jgi:DNA-binding NtrC family response regulator
MGRPLILTIDDDDAVNASLGLLLKQAGYDSASAAGPDEALGRLADRRIALVLQDMNFSRLTTGEEGLALLERIRGLRPDVPVVLMTAWGSIDLAVRGIKAGANDFITKPWSQEQVLATVRTALGLAARRTVAGPRARPTRKELDARYDLAGVVGEAPRFLDVLDLLCRISPTDASVLITGDSGTGKEVVTEAIHRNSPRSDKPFVKVNLGGISSSLFESEMFGHVRGAFTDAHRDRQGRFASAEGGTIFLDEIGELDLRSQVKMLRVLQDRTYEVLGTSETRTLDVRIVAASNRNLQQAVEKGRFREDLLYRLNLISVHLPALADRPGDVPLLARHFLAEAARAYGKEDAALSDEALGWLERQAWPGNVRQLRQFIARALLVADVTLLDAEHLRRVREMDAEEGGGGRLPPVGSMTLDEVERSMILKSLEHHGGNISRVAESLGMSRAALYRRLEKHGIKR